MRDEPDSNVRTHMLDYLVSLLDDAQDFSWDSAKASHAVLLCRMEQGEVGSYLDTDKIDRIRRANAQRHSAGHSNFSNKTKVKKSTVCQYFNKGTCSFSDSHTTKNTFFKHICNNCHVALGKSFSHPETECSNKRNAKNSKNE